MKKPADISIILSIISLVLSLTILVVWCIISFHIETLSVPLTESVLVAILGILVTLLIGWNIYTIIDVKQLYRNLSDSQSKIDAIENNMQVKSEKQTALSDAYASMELSEMFFIQGKYVLTYLKILSAISCFEKAEEHRLALHECRRMYMLIRTIRRHLAKQQNDYVLDYDLYADVAYAKYVADLSARDLEQFNVSDMRTIFTHLITLSAKQITYCNAEFTVYERDADIKERPLAIYLLLEQDKMLYKTMEYDKYLRLLTEDLNLNHDTIAIAEFSSLEKCKQAYELIKAQQIGE